MSDENLQKSPHWEQRKDQRVFSQDEMYDEGYPANSFMGDGKVYEILTNRGEIHQVIFDTSMRYRAEGVCWRTVDDREIYYRENVVAWRQII